MTNYTFQPGDKSFNLGPHLDGGSLERWEDPEYRKCYSEILKGEWENHDPFSITHRLKATVDMYHGPGGCSAFRSYQVEQIVFVVRDQLLTKLHRDGFLFLTAALEKVPFV